MLIIFNYFENRSPHHNNYLFPLLILGWQQSQGRTAYNTVVLRVMLAESHLPLGLAFSVLIFFAAFPNTDSFKLDSADKSLKFRLQMVSFPMLSVKSKSVAGLLMFAQPWQCVCKVYVARKHSAIGKISEMFGACKSKV